MLPSELDDVDRGILHKLQEDARNNTAADIADAVDVAPNTVRSRIEKLEARGVIQGYHPHIDYEQAGYSLRDVFVATVPISERAAYAEKALGIEGTIGATEVLSGRRNLLVEAVAADSDDLTRIASSLEAIGIDIEDELFLKSARVQPFDNFGIDVVDD